MTPKQNQFVAQFLVDGNATQAAIRAGYSAKTAYSAGERLLRNVDVARAVADAQKRRLERVELKADDVLRELLTFAKVDPSQAFDARGRLLPLRDMPEDVRRAISAVEMSRGRLSRVKFWDKTRGLELLGKYLQMFSEKVEHNHTGAVSIRVIDPYAEPAKAPEAISAQASTDSTEPKP